MLTSFKKRDILTNDSLLEGLEINTDDHSSVRTYNTGPEVLQSYGRDIYAVDTTKHQHFYSHTERDTHIIRPL